MKAFPFTEAEWAKVKDAALAVVNATLANDSVLSASHNIELFDVLERLRARHGDHPVLLETQADFTEDDAERIALYQCASSIAIKHGLPSFSIRLSLGRVLLEAGRQVDAAAELAACEHELPDCDESDRASWSELFEQIRNADPGNR